MLNFLFKHITITYILSPLKITQQNSSPGYIYLAITFPFYLADEFKVELYHTKQKQTGSLKTTADSFKSL